MKLSEAMEKATPGPLYSAQGDALIARTENVKGT